MATGEKRVLAVNSALLIFIHELKTPADEPDHHHQCVLDEVATTRAMVWRSKNHAQAQANSEAAIGPSS